MNFKSIVIEGGDQIGKGDVTHYLLKHFSDKNINISKISFPIYSSPFGYIVRKNLEMGFSGIKGVEDLIGTKREIALKMIPYSLNRLEALESILRRFENRDAYFLLDRSPYSSALTISYGLGGVKSIRKDEVRGLVELLMKAEQPFFKILNIKECVLHLMADFGKSGWKKSRSDGDLYEVKDVQEVTDYVYGEIANIVGEGWHRIYTKENGEFRYRKDIYREVNSVVDALSFKSEKSGGASVFDILEVAKDVYGIDLSKVDSYIKYSKNIKEDSNEKNKETYKMAYEIGKYIADSCKSINFESEELRDNAKELLDLYPEVFILLNHYLGEEFTQKVRKGIYD